MQRVSIGRSQLASIALAAALVSMIAAMLVPLPTPLVDLLLVVNLSAAVVIVLVSLFARDALDLSAFPSLLLLTTLFRLSLNVSTTRLILLQADAGQVVQSFGDFVVRGNYVVGAVVFLTITLIQFVVIARGSERVAEVGARFALDAMPGKQMSIDAERRSGTIGADEAAQRGRRLQRESEFYGAMDGAMKFVKGDAIAGLVIIAINLLGGLTVGALMQGMAPLQALEVYGLLTVGDGLVAQIPALLIATGAGIVVTRVSSEEDDSSLALDLAKQLLGDPRPMYLLAAFLGVLAVIPGLPWIPFAVMALVAVLIGTILRGYQGQATLQESKAGAIGEATESSIWVDVDAKLLPQISATLLRDRVPRLRQRLADGRGIPLPPVGLRPMEKPGFSIYLHECSVASGPITSTSAVDTIDSALSKVVHERGDELLDLQTVQGLIDAVAKRQPTLVKALVPQKLELTVFADVLRRLAREQFPLRPFGRVLEAISETTSSTNGAPDPAELVEAVRRKLRRRLLQELAEDRTLRYHALDAMVDDLVRDSIQPIGGKRALAMPKELATGLIDAVKAEAPSVLVVSDESRPFLSELLSRVRPELTVLGYSELDPDFMVEQVGVIEAV